MNSYIHEDSSIDECPIISSWDLHELFMNKFNESSWTVHE